MFNPPYVPTYDEEVDAAQRNAGISGSWAGGADGMQVTDAFLRQVDVGVFCVGVPWLPTPRIYRDYFRPEGDFTWSQWSKTISPESRNSC
jgi:hypothetical protein